MKPNLKAAFISHGPLKIVGGVERYNLYLIALLKKMGYEVDLFDPTMAKAPKWVLRYAYPIVQYYYTAQLVKNRLSEYGIVITNGFTAGCLRGSRIINISFGTVQSYHRPLLKPENWKLGLNHKLSCLLDRLSMSGKNIVALSEQVQEELRHDYQIESVSVPCGIDTDHFAPQSDRMSLRSKMGIPEKNLVGAFVGRWAWNHKGLDIFIQVMRKRPDIHWLIAADSQPALEDFKNVTILPNAPYESLPKIYSAADFCVQLSRYESFGFSFVESLACGTPVITTPVGIAPTLYREAPLKQLLVCAPGIKGERQCEAEVLEKIGLFENNLLLKELSLKAREKAVQEHSLDVWASRMEKIITAIREKSG